METLLELQSLTPVHWRLLRAARLAALLDSPAAFTSSHAQESKWAEREWRRVFDAATWIVALEAEKAIGLARSVGAPGHGTRHVESIWVAPTHRQRGVCRALLHALAEMDRRQGGTDLMLWVLEDNQEAQSAYKALGFEPTGERQFLPDFERFERQLRVGIERLLDAWPSGRRVGGDHSITKLGQRPGVQLKEVHGVASAANIVHPVREPLPVVEVVTPRIEEVHAKV
jgi:ribosomal protein S18 acetylase RimI-like enzyme